MAELMIKDRAFVEDERKTIESKDYSFIMATSHASERADEDVLRVRVHVEADLDILLPHSEKYSREENTVSLAISQCLNYINPPMAFYPNMGCAV